MKIAVVGAGFSGLAAAWFACISLRAHVTLFDSNPLGQSTSGISAGLLHPFAGAHSRLNWLGYEGLQATKNLLDIASKALNQKVYRENGLLRPILDEQQEIDYKACAEAHPDRVDLWNERQCLERFPGMAQVPGIYIKDGIAVDTKLYLRGLYKACEQHGAQYVNKNIETLNDLADYDKIIVATGTGVTRYSELSHLKIYCLKGQLLKLEWPIGVHPLPMPLNGYVYIVMDREGKNCWAGATFERDFKSELPDEAQAKSLILPKLEAMYPLLRGVSVLGCEAGIRATTPDKKPIYGWVNDRVGFISGMGSKGLLYHALCAERMFGDGSA